MTKLTAVVHIECANSKDSDQTAQAHLRSLIRGLPIHTNILWNLRNLYNESEIKVSGQTVRYSGQTFNVQADQSLMTMHENRKNLQIGTPKLITVIVLKSINLIKMQQLV